MGKGIWFPLLEGSVKADWRSIAARTRKGPSSWTPTNKQDVNLLDVNPEDGRACPSLTCIGPVKRERA